MPDRYRQLAHTPIGKLVVSNLGLPNPVELERYEPGSPVISGPVLLGGANGGRLAAPVAEVLASARAEVHTELDESLRLAAAEAKLSAKVWNPAAGGEQRFKALVFDATGIGSSEELIALFSFFNPTIRRLESSGRVIVLGTPPADAGNPRAQTAQRALEGFVRSTAKEVRRGSTAQLVYVAPGGEGQLESTLRFLLSPRSAYVSAQVVRIDAGKASTPELSWEQPLEGKVALVTGASRGIGEAIAETLARDGAQIVGLDIPALSDDLDRVTGGLGGSSIALDITEPDAPQRICDELAERHQGVDVFVHNAGVTRDKTIAGMDEERWRTVIDINLTAAERINDALLDRELIRANGRIVCVSSISGIAGNAGQSNYATSKAGVIGMVDSLAPVVAKQKLTINAVAPGFIETQMTAKIPLAMREAGRRMNSLSQGGLPIDVAETIAWFASPGSAGVNGNVVRVCGQSLLGA